MSSSEVKVRVYLGALKHKQTYYADHGTNKLTCLLSKDGKLSLPIKYEDILTLVDDILCASSLLCHFDEKEFLLLRETASMGRCGFTKPGHDKLLPVCVIIEKSFEITEWRATTLDVIVARTDTEEVKGSYIGGSEASAVEEKQRKRSFAVEKWAAQVQVHRTTHHGQLPSELKSLSLQSDLDAVGIMTTLVNVGTWALDRSPTVTDKSSVSVLQRAISAYLKKAPESDLSNLPAGMFMARKEGGSSLSSGPSSSSSSPSRSVSSQIPADVVLIDQSFILTRPLGQVGAKQTKHTIAWLKANYHLTVGLDVQLAEGTGNFMKDEWFNLIEVTDEHSSKPKNNHSFLLTRPSKPDEKRVRITWKHFLKLEEDADVESGSDADVESGSDADVESVSDAGVESVSGEGVQH
jgi:hypothetical protein